MTLYYAIVDYHVLSPSSRKAISPIADFIGCLTVARRPHLVFRV